MRRPMLAITTGLLLAAAPAMGALPASAGAAAGQVTKPDESVREVKAIDAVVAHNAQHLNSLYRDIHAHPELSLQETRTAVMLASEMRKLGLDVTEHVGGTGIVALLRNGDGPTVLIRTELDALPMHEQTSAPFASSVEAPQQGKTTFVAHSCGHDVHMAWWVGTAQALLALRDQWRGTVLFVGQPAEESGGGAARMVADGLFKAFPKPDFGFAAHVGNDPVGMVRIKQGPATSNSDTVRIRFNGKGGHGSMPSYTIDPIVMGARFITDVQSIVSRQKDPFAFGVITVGSFQAGSAPNIIPDSASLGITVRSYTPVVRTLLVDGIIRTARAVADISGAPAPDIEHKAGSTSVFNDVDLAALVAQRLRAADIGRIDLMPESAPASSASEDYSDLQEGSGMRSVYFYVGGYDPGVIAGYRQRGEPVPTNHSSKFLPDAEATVPVGVRTLSLAALAVLAPAGPDRQ